MPSFIVSNGLRSCLDFGTLTDAQLEELAGICKVIDYPAGHDVFSIEEQERYVFVVVLGRLALRLKSSCQIEYFKAGDLFGEVAVFSQKGRLGAIHCLEKSTLLAIDKDKVFSAESLSIELRLQLITLFAQKMAGYFYKKSTVPLSVLINNGESSTIEFKTSFAEKSAIEESIISFMNWKGGTILVGVQDNGQVIGLSKEHNEIDEMANRLLNNLKNKSKQITATYVDYQIETIGQKKVLRINVSPSDSPAILHTPKISGQLLVRTGTQNTHLKELSEIVEYARKRFEEGAVPLRKSA